MNGIARKKRYDKMIADTKRSNVSAIFRLYLKRQEVIFMRCHYRWLWWFFGR